MSGRGGARSTGRARGTAPLPGGGRAPRARVARSAFHAALGSAAHWPHADGVVLSLPPSLLHSFLRTALALLFYSLSSSSRWQLRSLGSFPIFSNKAIKAKNCPLWMVLATSHKL